MNEGQRLAAVQVRGHLAIDAIYGPLARDTAAMVLRTANSVDGTQSLTLDVLPLFRSRLGQLLTDLEMKLVRSIASTAREAESIADPDGAVDETALLLAGFTTAASMRRNQPMVVDQASELLLRGISLGLSVADTARTVQQYFSPWFAPRRDATGKVVRGDRLGMIVSWPGRAGMASQHARGLMLFETTSAQVRGTRRAARRYNDLLRFHVSHKHLEIDQCDLFERQDNGFGPGIYEPDEFPSVPVHFRCRCWAERADRPRFLTLSESVAA